jgi:hypothetical protein
MEIEKFVRHIQAVVDAYYRDFFPDTKSPVVTIEDGKVYWKIVNNNNGSRSVYGFVRKEDGAIFRAAGWKAPAIKAGIRGYLNDYPDELLGAYGIAYKNMPSFGPKKYPTRPN